MYRDGLAGLANQIADKHAALARLEQEVSPFVRTLLPEHMREVIAEWYPRAFASVDGADMASLATIAGALDTLLALFDEARTMAPNLRRCPDEVPDPPNPHGEPPWLIEERPLLAFREAVSNALLRFAPGAHLEQRGDFGYISRFCIEDIPLVFTTRMVFHYEPGRPKPMDAFLPPSATGFASSLRTSLPEAIPFFGIQKETWAHAVAKALHLGTERQLGVEPFDDRFWLTGAEPPLPLLDASVRGALLAIVDHRPVLRVGYGLADLAWSGSWDEPVGPRAIPKASIDIVVGLRQAVASA